MDFKMEQTVKVIFSKNISIQLLDILQENSYVKPMVVIDSFLLSTPIIEDMLAAFKKHELSYVIFDKVIPDPPIEIINSGAEEFLSNNCDSIIAIGGGSVIDSARGINIVRSFGGDIKDYVSKKEIPMKCKGLIAIPTTSGTGSELSNALIVTDTEKNEKMAILSDNAVSEFAILSPDLVKTLPKELTIMTGLDVFSHAAEAYTSKLSSPIIDSVCEKIMFLVFKYLPQAVNDPSNLEVRERMMVASALGGWVLNNGGTHLGHSLAHVIGATYHIPHGMACAYTLPVTLEYTAKVLPKKVREIGNILNLHISNESTPEEIGLMVSSAYKQFRDEGLGLNSFEEQNIKKSDLTNLVDKVVNERFVSNSPFSITSELISEVIEKIG